jgi:hypothetical protein
VAHKSIGYMPMTDDYTLLERAGNQVASFKLRYFINTCNLITETVKNAGDGAVRIN